MTVVFATYQSIDVVGAGPAGARRPFDLIVCDEAHRTTGVTLAGEDESAFVRVHDNDYLQATKRLYMTATPRIYDDASKAKAGEANAVLASMDDEDLFGPEFHRLGFGEAVERGLLTDYKVLVLAVDETSVGRDVPAAARRRRQRAAASTTPPRSSAAGTGWQNAASAEHSFEPDPAPDASGGRIRRHHQGLQDVSRTCSRRSSTTYAAAHELDDDGKTRCSHARSSTSTGRSTPSSATRGSTGCSADAAERHMPHPHQRPLPVRRRGRARARRGDVPLAAQVGRRHRPVRRPGHAQGRPGKKYGYIILPIGIPAGMTPEDGAARQQAVRRRLGGPASAARPRRTLQRDGQPDRADQAARRQGQRHRRRRRATGTGRRRCAGHARARLPRPRRVARRDLRQDRRRRSAPAGTGATGPRTSPSIASRHITRITALLDDPKTDACATSSTSSSTACAATSTTASRETDAVEMLAQHLITRPVFDALFGGYDFPTHNPVAQTMERMLDSARRARPRRRERRPREVLRLRPDAGRGRRHRRGPPADHRRALRHVLPHRVQEDRRQARHRLHPGRDRRLHPALRRRGPARRSSARASPTRACTSSTGSPAPARSWSACSNSGSSSRRTWPASTPTSCTPTRSCCSPTTSPPSTSRPRTTDLVARLDRASSRVRARSPGLVLTDTFQSWEDDDRPDLGVFPENNERLERLKKLPITVIVGNPPYSIGAGLRERRQRQREVPALDAAIRDTYADRSTATNKNSLYDSYIRAIKWATLRIKDRGVIAFVTNGGWLDSNTADGMRTDTRRRVQRHLRLQPPRQPAHCRRAVTKGRRQGLRRRQSRATVAITVLVKRPRQARPQPRFTTRTSATTSPRAEARQDRGSWQHRAARLRRHIAPNAHGDWLNQRSDDFEHFCQSATRTRSGGRSSLTIRAGSRPTVTPGCYNFVALDSATAVCGDSIDAYDGAIELAGRTDAIVPTIPTRDQLERGLRSDLAAAASTRRSMRSSARHGNYTDPSPNSMSTSIGGLNDMVYRLPSCFPTHDHRTSASAHGHRRRQRVLALMLRRDSRRPLSARARASSLRAGGTRRSSDERRARHLGDDGEVIDGYRRIDNITDAALSRFRSANTDDRSPRMTSSSTSTGCCTRPSTARRYAADLKKMLPRIPLVGPAAIHRGRSAALRAAPGL